MKADIRYVTPVKWILHRGRLLAYARKHGGSAVPDEAIRALAELDPLLLAQPDEAGAAAVVVRQNGIVAGFAAAAGWGRDACFVVVHPGARGRGFGTRLLAALLARLGRLEARIPERETASLAVCRRAGLRPDGATLGPEGKLIRMAGTTAQRIASARPRAADEE